MLENLRESLRRGDISNIIQISRDLDFSETQIRDIFLSAAIEAQSIIPYTVLCGILIKEETSLLHAFASYMLSSVLCWIEGAYFAGYYHQKKAIELAPDDVKHKEFMLMYNSIPDKPLSDEDALILRKEILKTSPNSEIVKNHFASERFCGKF